VARHLGAGGQFIETLDGLRGQLHGDGPGLTGSFQMSPYNAPRENEIKCPGDHFRGMEKSGSTLDSLFISSAAMTSPRDEEQQKETVVFYDMSPELEEELLRRARQSDTDPSTEAAKILEDHARDAGDMQ